MKEDLWRAKMFRLGIVLLLSVPLLAAPVPKDASPRRLPPNSNTLFKAHAGKITFEASSSYAGWEAGKLIDGVEATSWFSADSDSPMRGKKPWVRATFGEDVTVRRVTILGNREPNFPTGYFVTAGTLELLDAAGQTLHKADVTSTGPKHDFDFDLFHTKGKVRAIRFTCTQDEKQMSCIALAELQVE